MGPDVDLAIEFDEFQTAALPVSRHLMIAYDEVYSIKFLGRKLPPYWRRERRHRGRSLARRRA